MCFSATASFTSSAVIAAVGIATLFRSRGRAEWLFASIPLLFAFHQFAEGAVWLGLTGTGALGPTPVWGFIYMLYAQGVLTLLIPLAVWLIEPDRKRRLMVVPFLLLGAALTLYQLWALVTVHTNIYVEDHSVVYRNAATHHVALAVLYVIATCGSLFVSGYRYIIALAAMNLAGVVVVILVKQYAFTSVWCAYAAFISVLIYAHFARRRKIEALERSPSYA